MSRNELFLLLACACAIAIMSGPMPQIRVAPVAISRIDDLARTPVMVMTDAGLFRHSFDRH